MGETTMDIKDIFRVLKKRQKLIGGVFATAVAVAVAVSFLMTATYEASATLRVKQPRGLESSLLAEQPVTMTNNTSRLMTTYAETLKGRTVVETMIAKTQGEKESPPSYEQMLKQIDIQPIKDTEILKVTVQAESAEKAKEMADALVVAFTDRLTGLSRTEHADVRQFIAARLAATKTELEQAEERLQQYKRAEKIASPTEQTRAMVERVTNVTRLAADNDITLAAAQARQQIAAAQLAAAHPGFVADSPLIQQLKGRLAEQQVQLVGLQQTYTDNYPQVMELKASINETKIKLDDEAARIVKAEAPSVNPVHQAVLLNKIQAEAEVAASRARNSALDALTAKQEEELSQLPRKEQGLAKALREVDVAREIYVMLAKRHEEARISEVMRPTDVQVIDMAGASTQPVTPNKARNIGLGAVTGLFLGIGLAFGKEYQESVNRDTTI